MKYNKSYNLILVSILGLSSINCVIADAQQTDIPIVVVPHLQTTSGEARTLSYDIHATVPYEVDSDVSWAAVEQREGGIYVHVEHNSSYDSREAHITFTYGENSSTQTLLLRQGVNENTLVQYFRSVLAGKTAEYTDTETITHEAIETVRDSVWGAWKLAVSTQEGQSLLNLAPLSYNTRGEWKIPEGWPETGSSMAYYYGSRGTKPATGYPLFLYLHGSGDRELEFSGGYNFAQRMETTPSVHFVPRIPQTGQWYRWYQQSKQWAWEKLIREAMASGKINPDRIYVLGISEGGYGGQRIASFYADYWAAAGPMAGGEPLKNAPPENLRNTPFSLRTGSLDTDFSRNLLTGYTRDALDSLQALYPDGYEHWVQLIQGAGHGIDYDPTPVWLKKYVRNPQPLHVCWEDYDMDGRRRQGFANLEVIEIPNPYYRTRYDEDIVDNTVTITVKSVDYTTVEQIDGIETRFEKSAFTPNVGKFRVYLSETMVDLSSPVRIVVNGKEKFNGLLQPNIRHMANSMRLFFDPRRIFPVAVDISLE